MLWFIRKVCGAVALVWLSLWGLFLVSVPFDPKAAASAFVLGTFTSVLGAPASIIWAVLKVIGVLGARNASPPAARPARPSASSGSNGLSRVDRELLAVGTEARHDTPSPPDPEVYTYLAPGLPMCPECGRTPTIFYCTVHQRGLCLECVAKHDMPSECVYVPAFRTPKQGAGPGRPPGGPKTGDVFGIS
jgi:B-box zinc finger